jgi:catechol 2,3-dioxygenase-like lactoylglutathione lyase family enzyme
MEDFYPMPAFVTLEVMNIVASVSWYENALGFRVVFQSPPAPAAEAMMVHLRRDRYQDLLLFSIQDGDMEKRGGGVILNFLPGDESVIARRAASAGSSKVEGPIDRPWNVKEITILDPDGYRIRFSEVLDPDKSFDDVVGQGWGGD